MDETAYPQLIENIQNIQPFLLLWGTCDNFINQSEAWLNGPFRSLDPEAMSEEVETMWRVLHKSVKTFGDYPQPRKVAEAMKNKIDKFNKDMPLVQALGGASMQGRHWDAIHEFVGRDVRPGANTTLKNMLDYNLGSHFEKIEEVSVKASKEHALEKTLEKMQEDWADVVFNLLPYRDSVSFTGLVLVIYKTIKLGYSHSWWHG